MGRPSKRTPALIDQICARLSKGEPMASICRDDGFPDPSTVWDWAQADDTVSQSIARARERGFDAIAAECLDIADDGRNDFVDKLNADGEVIGRTLDAEHVQRSKLRVETRLKLLAKWDPKRYGEFVRSEVSGPGGGPVQQLSRIELVPLK